MDFNTIYIYSIECTIYINVIYDHSLYVYNILTILLLVNIYRIASSSEDERGGSGTIT